MEKRKREKVRELEDCGNEVNYLEIPHKKNKNRFPFTFMSEQSSCCTTMRPPRHDLLNLLSRKQTLENWNYVTVVCLVCTAWSGFDSFKVAVIAVIQDSGTPNVRQNIKLGLLIQVLVSHLYESVDTKK